MALALTFGAARFADAEEAAPAIDPSSPAARRRSPLAIGAAVVPGLLVHGSGHFVAGDAQTGRRLLLLEGLGFGTLAVGFIPIVASGASRRLVGPAAALTIGGVGVFVITALADLYGVLAPLGGTGASSRTLPSLETELGYRYVYDPVFSYRDFIVYGIDARHGHWRVHPSAWFALDDSNSRVRALFSYRWVGPMPDATPSTDGSYIDVASALTRHAYLTDGFVTLTGELSVEGRLDMQRVSPSLKGSFAEMGVGWALQDYRYQVKGASNDVGELLLARFGYGIYIGWPGAPRGEVMMYYDHRHDGFAAGLKIPGLGSGVAGHFGLEGHAYLSDHWGVAAEAVAGSAYVTGVSLLFRHGEAL